MVGRKPLGQKALTNAEKQARYRAARAVGKPSIHYQKPTGRRSRPQRWRAAVGALVELQAEYQEWLDSLPDSVADGPMAEALQAICDLDLSELESITLPRGFGRD